MISEKICIGIALKPQGVVGEIKIKDLSAGFKSIKNVKTVFIDDVSYQVLQIRSFSGSIFLTLKGISDRNASEAFRQKEIWALRSEIEIPQNEYYIVDVIGCDFYLSSGKLLGKIVDIISGKTDVYTVETAEGNAVFPMLKTLEPIFDVENKKVTVDAKKFTEVVMYED